MEQAGEQPLDNPDNEGAALNHMGDAAVQEILFPPLQRFASLSAEEGIVGVHDEAVQGNLAGAKLSPWTATVPTEKYWSLRMAAMCL